MTENLRPLAGDEVLFLMKAKELNDGICGRLMGPELGVIDDLGLEGGRASKTGDGRNESWVPHSRTLEPVWRLCDPRHVTHDLYVLLHL